MLLRLKAFVIFLTLFCGAVQFLPARGQDAQDVALLRSRVQFLASPRLAGRLFGTKGNDEAAIFIAECFRRAGLAPLGTSRLHDANAPLDRSGYFQPFKFVAGVAPGRANSVEATMGGKTERLKVGVDFEPASVSASGEAEGKVLFAGYGIQSRDPQRNDYQGAAVPGNIVLVLAGAPTGDPANPLYSYASVQHKAAIARDLGAAALLVVSSSDADVPRFEDNGTTSDEKIPILLLGRPVARRWLKAAGLDLDRLEEQAHSSSGPIPLPIHVRLRTDVRKVRRVTANIAGFLPGADPILGAEVLVIGAHMDHLGMGGPYSLAENRKPAIHPGADDNASGTAGVLGLADRFAKSPIRPKRSILFVCFSGEELGLLGSAYYVRHPLIPLEHTVAMINMDMIGRLRDHRLTVLGTGTSPEWEEVLSGAPARGLTIVRSDSGFGGSDQQSFYGAGIPVLFFFTGLHADYHRPGDTADKINYSGEAEVLNYVFDVAARITNLAVRPGYRRMALPVQEEGPARFRASLGTIPDYSADVDGVLVSAVRPGSAAERAGIHGGDVLVRLGGRGIHNVRDLALALGEHKPGDTVEVVVRRNGQVLALQATLEAGRR